MHCRQRFQQLPECDRKRKKQLSSWKWARNTYQSQSPSILNLVVMTAEKICHRLHGLRTSL
eukprot:3648767-Prorocentrum_lima.AAC.1